MLSSPTFLHLCCELVEDHYGDFYRIVFECLAGARLTVNQVAQKCHLPLRQARAGIAGLIQLRLLRHHTTGDDSTIYSANLANAYDILRSGKLIEEARRQHGDLAASLVATACAQGFATIGELSDRVALDTRATDHQVVRSIEDMIAHLLRTNFLTRLRKGHFGEAHDLRRKIELKLLPPTTGAKLSGSKAKLEHEANVDREYDGLVNTDTSEHGFVNDGFLRGSNLEGLSSTNGSTSSNLSQPSQRSTLIYPNYYKIVEISQQALIVEHAKRLYGSKAARVAKCASRQAAVSDIWSKPPDHRKGSFEINVYKLLDDVNAEQHSEDRGLTSKVNGGTNGYEHDHTDMNLDEVEHQLEIMTEGPFMFLDTAIPTKYQINKEALDKWTCKEETLRVMDSRLDPPATRILRILIDKGKLEERTLQELGLLGAKELRQNLSLLKQMGYLELQEIPRNPTRQPMQTVFLWSYEADRVAVLVLETVYTSMTRLLSMLKLERERISSTLEKVAREDVRGREEEMLPPAELAVFTRFHKLESWVWAEIHRLDSTVAVLRDL